MFEVKTTLQGQQINYLKEGKCVGHAVINVSLSKVTLQWIEVDEKCRCNGYASDILMFIFKNMLKNYHGFRLTAVNENAHDFFYRFFIKFGVQKKDLMQWIDETDSGFEFNLPKGEITNLMNLVKENLDTNTPIQQAVKYF